MKDRMGLAGAVALAMLAFAGNSLLNRAALATESISPALFAAVRLGSGALVLSALVLARGRGVPVRTAGRAGDALALAVYVLGFSFAYRSLNAGIGALILFAAVQITMFGGALIQGEILPPRRWLGATSLLPARPNLNSAHPRIPRRKKADAAGAGRVCGSGAGSWSGQFPHLRPTLSWIRGDLQI